MRTRNILMASICGLAVGSAAAFSLGQAHGEVLLGRPIDVSFDVHLDPGMELETACLAARIISGENPLGQGQVQVTPLPPVAGRLPGVRVQSFRMADEPVLTIHLLAGCTGTITRTYVFLVDLPESIAPSTTPIAIPWLEPEATPPAPVRGLGGGANQPVVQSAQSARSEPARSPQGGTQPQQPAKSADVVVTPPPVKQVNPAQVPASAAKPRPPRPPAAPASQARSSGARLVMEPLAVVLGPAAGASAAVSAPAASMAASAPEGVAPPAQDASAPQPGSTGEEPARRALEDELATLRMQAASDRAAALVLQQRLERIESERFHPGVVYGLLGLVAVMLGWMVWQVLRFRTVFEQSTQAWSESVAMHERKASGSDD